MSQYDEMNPDPVLDAVERAIVEALTQPLNLEQVIMLGMIAEDFVAAVGTAFEQLRIDSDGRRVVSGEPTPHQAEFEELRRDIIAAIARIEARLAEMDRLMVELREDRDRRR